MPENILGNSFILPTHPFHLYLRPPEGRDLKTCSINPINCIYILTQAPTSASADTLPFPPQKSTSFPLKYAPRASSFSAVRHRWFLACLIYYLQISLVLPCNNRCESNSVQVLTEYLQIQNL